MGAITKAENGNGPGGDIVEQVIIKGDLKNLSPQERANYYAAVCESIGLNPLTKPFEYITLNGKLTLYARKDATDQLRRIYGVSISKPSITYEDDLIIVAVEARDREGRTDADVGVVSLGSLRGDARANAIMKAVTKGKRRVTLSICGLGMLDETELETIPSAEPFHEEAVEVEARLVDQPHTYEALRTLAQERGIDEVDMKRRFREAGFKVPDIRERFDEMAALLVEAHEVAS